MNARKISKFKIKSTEEDLNWQSSEELIEKNVISPITFRANFSGGDDLTDPLLGSKIEIVGEKVLKGGQLVGKVIENTILPSKLRRKGGLIVIMDTSETQYLKWLKDLFARNDRKLDSIKFSERQLTDKELQLQREKMKRNLIKMTKNVRDLNSKSEIELMQRNLKSLSKLNP